MKKIEILFAEFGGEFKPDIDNVKKYFPEAEVNVYGSSQCRDFFEQNTPYWGHYMNDYWKVAKLLESDADIAISLDADVKIVDERVFVLPMLAEKFGLCLPANPRKLVKIDTEIGSHSDKRLDETLGLGYAFNMTPIALDTHNSDAREILQDFCDIMIKNPVRGPLAMWRAVWKNGLFPCLLPPQWCVCAEDKGIGEEIILHKGHKVVREHYGI
jgi:hypothetical protein